MLGLAAVAAVCRATALVPLRSRAPPRSRLRQIPATTPTSRS